PLELSRRTNTAGSRRFSRCRRDLQFRDSPSSNAADRRGAGFPHDVRALAARPANDVGARNAFRKRNRESDQLVWQRDPADTLGFVLRHCDSPIRRAWAAPKLDVWRFPLPDGLGNSASFGGLFLSAALGRSGSLLDVPGESRELDLQRHDAALWRSANRRGSHALRGNWPPHVPRRVLDAPFHGSRWMLHVVGNRPSWRMVRATRCGWSELNHATEQDARVSKPSNARDIPISG